MMRSTKGTQPLFLFCTGIVVPPKQSDAPDTPCENPLTGKNLVNTIQKELDRDGGYSEEVAGKTVDHKGMDLNYFGARYYDPVIGYWISLDPKEQFWSGYSYSANDFNPVNAVDPDGMTIGEKFSNLFAGKGFRDDIYQENYQKGEYRDILINTGKRNLYMEENHIQARQYFNKNPNGQAQTLGGDIIF